MKPKDMRKYWIWLSNACGAGSKVAVSLVRHFGNAYEVFKADEEDYSNCNFRIDSRVKARLNYKDISDAEDIVAWCDNEEDVRILCPDDVDYPSALTSMADAPMVLYVKGTLPDFDNNFTCAVVGTRSMTDYGKRMSHKIGYGLAKCGSCVISGIAKGCDAAAMLGAIEAGGTTVAVLGCGIDVVYPPENIDLWPAVLKNGAIITEYSPGASPKGSHFPSRNRLISGLSQAVCVTEADMRSGSLITARYAIYQGKDLFAVPGQADMKNAEGANCLLKQGALLVTCAEDILANFEFLYPHTIDLKMIDKPVFRDENEEEDIKILKAKLSEKKKAKSKRKKKKADNPFPKEEKAIQNNIDYDMLGEDEKAVYRAMTPEIPMLADEICTLGGFSISKVMSALTLLEIAGAVESGAGGYFIRHADDEEVGEPSINEFDSCLE